ncbi:MAG TPA: phage/plasmid primase, P4 family [Gemmatimonadales bacterium]|nr:phage/plasmid primase, P4 family [Gemmatimonadales bacterium]
MNSLPVQWFNAGYRDLISVVPPNAPLSPGSRLAAGQLGKAPGRRLANGTWAGYAWLAETTTEEAVKQWSQDGANIGLRTERFPAVDIDCLDETLARELTGIATRLLGPAPIRTGRAPKSLLLYRLAGNPFARMALLIYPEGKGPAKPCHLLEVLGAGRQCVIAGQHPSGNQYTWNQPLPPAESLTPLSKEQVSAFFEEVTSLLEAIGCEVERVGNGVIRSREGADQNTLVAPSIDVLNEVVAMIPNPPDTDRDLYIKVGYALRAAWPEDEEAAFQVWSTWCEKHEGKSRGTPDDWRNDWRRMHPPYAVGFGWLAEMARAHGYNDAALDFEAVDAVAVKNDADAQEPIALSDQWATERIIRSDGHLVRYVPAEGKWYVWDQGRWRPDALNLAMHLAAKGLDGLSRVVARVGVTPKEQKESLTQARRLSSAYARDSVVKLMESAPQIALRPDVFDSDPWALNTPGGVLDLRTGVMGPHNPDALCSKMTAVAPDMDAGCPTWHSFLLEATNGQPDVIRYLQRVIGYCLTGQVSEQAFWMLWGPGGNGKSVFLNTVTGILGDYARTAPMDTFTSANNDRHPTELAMLLGARLVSASETQASRKWDEARVKGLTGGDPVTARFMRQDFFTYQPQFKLLFVGNHKPELQVADQAMRRRIHLIPFTVTPKVVDTELGRRLKSEWPAILAWAVRGCLDWQKDGLAAPPSVFDATEEYFNEQDAIGRWLDESTAEGEDEFVTTERLFESWREWAGRNGESAGTMRAFVARLQTKGLHKAREKGSRRNGFLGRRLLPFREELV